MSDNHDPSDLAFACRAFVLCALVFAVLFWFVSSCNPADAQELDGGTITLLTRACVAETDWSRPDCAAVLHVLKRRAATAGEPIEQMAGRYVAMLATHDNSPRARWVMQLTADCSEPADWDQSAGRWKWYAPKCKQLVADVQAFERGALPDPCGGATQWGSRTLPQDAERAARALKAGRWVLARCSTRTANAFYSEHAR
jgi:hypothetical protein